MSKPQPPRRSRDLAASDGFDSLHSTAPRPAARSFVPCLECDPWRPTPVSPRSVATVARARRRIREHRPSSAAESP